MRWCFSGGHISPSPPPQRKFINPSTSSLNTTAGSSSSSNEVAPSDEDLRRLKRAENSGSHTTRTSNRPSLAPKPKFDDRNSLNSSSLNDKKESLQGLQKSNGMDSDRNCVNSITRKLQKIGVTSADDSSSSKLTLGRSFASKGYGPYWSAHSDSGSTGAQNVSSSNESGSGSVVVNTTIPHDELSASSPSSSGIVADMNDSNGESNQRTSATSSLSSCEPSTDLTESNFDASRMGKTCPSRLDDQLLLGQEHRGPRQSEGHFNGIEGAVGTTQRYQFDRVREPCSLILTNLEEKNGPKSGFTLQDVLNSPTTVTSTTALGGAAGAEQRLNLSLNFNNQRGFAQRSDRSPSMAPEGLCGNRYIPEDLANQRHSLDSGGNSSTNDENARKQTICSKLAEHYRHIESSVEKLNKCTAARAWRQPHILQQHIFDIKEQVGVIACSVNGFMDAACRIAIDVINPKSEGTTFILFNFSSSLKKNSRLLRNKKPQLKQLLLPLKNSTALITQLKQNLDSTGWTLSALSRPRNNIYATTPGSDALDQFLAVIKQLPIDCCKLIQWALLVVPSAGVRFLTNGLKDQLNFDNVTRSIYRQPQDDPLLRMGETNGRTSIGTDLSRQSVPSTASTMTVSSVNDGQAPQSILTSRTTLGQSTAPTTGKQNRVTFADDLTTSYQLSDSILETHVLEEDDLESVIGERDGFYQDSTIEGGDAVGSRKMRPMTNVPQLPQLNAEMLRSLSDDDRQLMEFYSPQLDAHTEFLSKAIEEFLTVIEEQMPPHEFVQKGKLIILTAHKLIYMADTIAEFISSGDVSREVKHAADRLLDVLKTCVQATKHAADEYLSVSAVQSMANCIVTVSRAAYDLKLLVKQCCSNS
ncbi:unnamed protein product [Litomosoides sigmodontis]|uniref:CAS family C-terminal domain-containing protein n=1 Tax=Litomosoides sigmodontis TaxID=42156 RepID=A0A3P6SQF5_LITSI|nr:unnamed protein product [Litomosoides sigmodontis]